jgi:hypothetical protein
MSFSSGTKDGKTHEAIKGCTVANATKVAHGPDSWPETEGVVHAREHDAGLEAATGEAELRWASI